MHRKQIIKYVWIFARLLAIRALDDLDIFNISNKNVCRSMIIIYWWKFSIVRIICLHKHYVHNNSKYSWLSILVSTSYTSQVNHTHQMFNRPTFFKFLRRTYIMSVQILMRAIMKNRIPMPLYIPFKQSIVTYTHIENFFCMPEHKLMQKRKTFRKFGVQTFALIELNNRRTPCLCSRIESAWFAGN